LDKESVEEVGAKRSGSEKSWLEPLESN